MSRQSVMRGDTPRHTREGAAYGTHGIWHPGEGGNSQRNSYKSNSLEERADAVQEGPYNRAPPLSHLSRSNKPACSAATGGMIRNMAMRARIRKRRRKRKNGKMRPLQPPTRRLKRLRNSRRNANGQRSGNTSYRHLYSTGRATTSSCTIYHCEAAAATSGT